MLVALPMTTKLSGSIEGVITRRFQFQQHYFVSWFTGPVRKVLFEQSPSSAPGARADVCDAHGEIFGGGGNVGALPMTTKLSGKIEEVVTRRF